MTEEDGRSDSNRVAQRPSNGALESAINGFISVIRGQPIWFQAFVIMAVLAVGAWLIYLKYVPPNPAPGPGPKVIATANSEGDSNPYLSRAGQPSSTHPVRTDFQTVEASHKAEEDRLAAAYHQDHEAEDPAPMVKLGSSNDPNNTLYYKYYEKMDRCLYINRVEAGVHWIQWVRDPQYHLHDLDEKREAQNDAGRSESWPIVAGPARLAGMAGGLVPVALADSAPEIPAAGERVQAGFCINPHPGGFRSWWGAPLDQCNSPMYRQFGDGCTHFQVFNRCSNAWNAQINWVTCNPGPHH